MVDELRMARRLLCGLGMNKHTNFTSIDLNALDAVTGGKAQQGTELPGYMAKAVRRWMRENGNRSGDGHGQVHHANGRSFLDFNAGRVTCNDKSGRCFSTSK